MIILKALAYILLLSSTSFAQEGHQHPKHNMILFGENEVFVSHKVFKQPHNYQILLKLELDSESYARYLSERAKYPKARFIYLLNEMDIAAIDSATLISGAVFRTDDLGNKVEILPRVELARAKFEIIYFNELPLSLSADHLESSFPILQGSCSKPPGIGLICEEQPNGTCHCYKPR